MSSKRSLPDLLWVFGFAFAVRLLVLSRFGDSAYFLPTSEDMKFYAEWAKHIAAGQWTDHRAFYGLPGYPFLLGGIFALIGFDPFSVGFLQILSEAAIAALLFQIAAWAFPGSRARVIGGLAALGWTFYQPAQALSVILMPTTWAVLLFWGVFCWSARTTSRSLWRPWLGMGLLTGVVAMMVATVFFILPIPIAVAVRNLRRPVAILAAVACLLGGVIVGTSPCWLHNYFIAGEPVLLSAHSGLNFWIGNNPDANGYPKLPPGMRASQEGMLRDSIRMAEKAAGHPLKRAEISRYWSAKANAYIHEHPREWLLLMGIKIKNLWNAAQYDDLSIITPFRDEGIVTPGLRFGWVAVFAIPGFVFAWRRHPRSRWIAAAVCLHMAALLPVFVTERYRLAAVPGLLLLAACGLSELQEALARRRWREVSARLAMGAAALWIVTLPQHTNSLWSLDVYNSGLKALEIGDMPRAKEKLERALAYTPENAEVNTALGNYWFHASDFPRAKWFYVRALQLDPRTVVALNNLALLEIMEGHFAQAKGLLKATLEIEPEDPKALNLIADCESKLQAPTPTPSPAP